MKVAFCLMFVLLGVILVAHVGVSQEGAVFAAALLLFGAPYFALCAVVAALGKRRGYSPVSTFIVSLFMTPLIGAFVIACLGQRIKKPA